jgi:quinol monooxygenase YgiN
MADVLTVVARIYPKAGQEDAVQALLLKMADAVRRHEPDCLIYRPHRLEGQAPIFLFYEQYRSGAAFEFHKTAPHLAAHRAEMRALVRQPTEVELYRLLAD